MHNLAMCAARFMAICGGLVLALLILLICISVVGRSLNGVLHGWIGTALPAVSAWLLQAGVGPINGDFELVEVGVASLLPGRSGIRDAHEREWRRRPCF